MPNDTIETRGRIDRTPSKKNRGAILRETTKRPPKRTGAKSVQTQTTEQTFDITIFKGAKLPENGEERRVTLREVVEEFRKPKVRKEKDGELLYPGTFKDGYRLKENIEEITMLALDFDGKLDLSLAKRQCAEGLPESSILHTTHSNQRVTNKHPKAEDCYRIFFPLKEPMRASDFETREDFYEAHALLWRFMNSWFYNQADPQVKIAWGVYPPAIYSEDAPYEFHVYDKGNFLDWRFAVEWQREIEETEAERKQVEREEKASGTKHDGLSVWDDYNRRADIEPFILDLGGEPTRDCADGRQWHHPDSEHPGSVVELTHLDGVKFAYFRTDKFESAGVPQYSKLNALQLRALKEYGRLRLSKAEWRALAKKLRDEGYGGGLRTHDKPKASAQQSENKYFAESSGLVWEKQTGEKVPLCNFVAEITGEVIRDDGTEQTDVYEVTATMNGAPKIGTVTASEFPSLKWVNKLLGVKARVYVNRDKYVADAIRALSENVKTRTVVAHTGWRNDGDGWKYYHAGGAISTTGLVEAEVSLSVQLENLSLVAPPDGAQLSGDVRAVFDDLLNVTPNNPAVMVAGVGEVLCSVFSKPDFSGFDFGTTGTRKSQIQALKQSFFGRKYTDENLPENWKSSEYGLETFASKIKDAAGCVDEFRPEGTGTARERWHTKADYVLRGAANKQGRTTLKQDRSERPARIPQGLLFCSGEELPIGESLRARLSIKEYDDKTVDLARLTTAQKQAADGVYVRVMSAFIQWLATDSRIETLREQRDDEIARRRQEWLSAGVNSHGRTANNNAHLEWAWDTFFAFVSEKNLIDGDSLEEYRALVASALDQHGRNQAKYLVTANDALKFVEFIQNAILSGKAHLTDQRGEMPDDPVKWGWKKGTGFVQAQGTCIGYVNGDEVYLLPDESYRIASDGGTGTDKIRATKDALQKRLREEGLLAYTTETGNPKNNKNTVQKRFRGARAWMLAFKASTFVGDGADDDTEPDADNPLNEEPGETQNVVYGKFRRLSGGK